MAYSMDTSVAENAQAKQTKQVYMGRREEN
jgi:hypothetical protein